MLDVDFEHVELDQPVRCDLVEDDDIEHVELDQPARCNLPDDDDEGSRPDRRIDASSPTVGANCHGIVKSSLDMGAIRLGIR